VDGSEPDTVAEMAEFSGAAYAGPQEFNYKIELCITETDPPTLAWRKRTDDPEADPSTWDGSAQIQQEFTPIMYGIGVRFKPEYTPTQGDCWTVYPDADLPYYWRQWDLVDEDFVNKYSLNINDYCVNITGFNFVVDRRGLAPYAPSRIRINDEVEPVIMKIDTDAKEVTLYNPLTSPTPSGSTFMWMPGYQEFWYNDQDDDGQSVTDKNGHAIAFVNKRMYRDFRAGNYGLARMTEEYGIERSLYHCPTMTVTQDVQMSANLVAGTQGARQVAPRRFDPLFSGYNTYDITYNYDQYYNQILFFDARMGYGDVNMKRQLRAANPPADTVVTWCYAHRPDDTPAIRHDFISFPCDPWGYAQRGGTRPRPENCQVCGRRWCYAHLPLETPTPEVAMGCPAPDLVGKEFDPYDPEEVRAAEQADLADRQRLQHGRSKDRVVVLWLDGSVAAVTPYLARGYNIDAGGGKFRAEYYWVPPFLYSQGEWRQ